MSQMPEKTVHKLMVELGVNDKNFVAQKIEEETSGTVLEKLVQSSKDLVYCIWDRTINAIWHKVQEIVALLIPQLFLRYMSGAFLDEYAYNKGQERDPGTLTILELTITKETGSELTIRTDDIFFIVETDPRRYQPTSEVTADSETTQFTVRVQALAPTELVTLVRHDEHGQQHEVEIETIYSKKYNAAIGLDWDSESALPVTRIEYTEVEFVQTGNDPETDEALRQRLYALEALKDLVLGVDLYYTNLIKTTPNVTDVKLTDVDPLDATLYYTLYGENGELSQETIDEAQALFDSKKMRTDKAVLSGAQPTTLNITIARIGGGSSNEIIDMVGEYFQDIGRGSDFESCFLRDMLGERWEEMTSRITPQFAELPNGSFFVPVTTVEEIIT